MAIRKYSVKVKLPNLSLRAAAESTSELGDIWEKVFNEKAYVKGIGEFVEFTDIQVDSITKIAHLERALRAAGFQHFSIKEINEFKFYDASLP